MSPTLKYLPVCFFLFLNGCAVRVGPKTIARDRFDYTSALSNSWKEQMIMNMVKARYLDPPMFMDVAQVVTSYTFEGSASVNLPDWEGAAAGSAAGISGRWAESPVITYNPLVGEKFTRSLLQPIPPIALFSLVQAGWPIDVVFSIAVRAINGLYAATHVEALKKQGDTDFYRVVKMLRELQLTGAFALRVEKGRRRRGSGGLPSAPGGRANRGDRTCGQENARPQSGSQGVQHSIWRRPERRHRTGNGNPFHARDTTGGLGWRGSACCRRAGGSRVETCGNEGSAIGRAEISDQRALVTWQTKPP